MKSSNTTLVPRSTRFRFGRMAPWLVAATGILGGGLIAQQNAHLGYQDTPLLPGGKWHVHDGLRPQPKVIDPGTASAQEAPGKPPSDAVILFNGKDLAAWHSDKGGPATWKVEDGVMVAKPGSGSITTRDSFGDCQLHVEWAAPTPPRGTGQDRGNSGIFLFGRYEFQVLDNYEAQTYPDGQAGAIYGQYPPLVNASRKPGEWQTYDILFTGPRFKDGQLVTPAYATVMYNGVVVQNHSRLLGSTMHRQLATYTPHDPKGPISLQDHGHPVRYRNIWIRDMEEVPQL